MRASLGSLSGAVTVFDPERLEAIIAEPGEESERRGKESERWGKELIPLGRDPKLQDLPGLLTVVDGTLLSALP